MNASTEQRLFRHLHQTITKHDPPLSVGDCQRTCVAMVLGLEVEDVPHYAASAQTEIEIAEAERKWFRERGFNQIALPIPGFYTFQQLIDLLRDTAGDTPVIVTGKSLRGEFNHDVVVYKGEFYDPMPGGLGFTEPALDNDNPDADRWWWVRFFAPPFGSI